MTDGERMVWAAFYATVLDRTLYNPPHITMDSERWTE